MKLSLWNLFFNLRKFTEEVITISGNRLSNLDIFSLHEGEWLTFRCFLITMALLTLHQDALRGLQAHINHINIS